MAQCVYCKTETEMYAGGDVPTCVECSDARDANRKATEQQIRTTLFKDMLEATALHNEATREFEAVMGQFPTGLPHPVGAQRINNASSKLSTARKRMMTAHERLNDYLGRGIVPEGLMAAHEFKTG